MKRKNIKFILLAVMTSVAMGGCGTDDNAGTASEGKGKAAESIMADNESNADTKKGDKEEIAGDEIKTSDEESSVDKESTAADQTSEETEDNSSKVNADSQGGNSENTAAGTDKSNAAANGSNTGTGGSTANTNSGNTNSGNANTNSGNTNTGSSGTGTGGSTKPAASDGGGNTGNGNSNTGSDKGTSDSTVTNPTTAAVSVGNANSQISEHNKDIVNDNKTEYTDISNNSASKKIYVSEDSVNYGYALAYVNGDTSRLNATQKQIFAAVKPLIDNVMVNYGTDHDREKAIHDYIVANCRYNIEDCTNNPMEMEAYNFHPEGVFLKKKAVCQGYAESFKLCMDLLGIRCDIVTGTANGQAHAWNAVCLDNEWYQIDCTWDDSLIVVNGQMQDSGRVIYTYFNITDAQMKKDHVYTYGNLCNGTRYNYDYFAAEEYGTIYPTVSDFSNYVNSELSAGKNNITAYVRCEGNVTINSYLYENQIKLENYPASGRVSMTYQAGGVSDNIYVIKMTIAAE